MSLDLGTLQNALEPWSVCGYTGPSKKRLHPYLQKRNNYNYLENSIQKTYFNFFTVDISVSQILADVSFKVTLAVKVPGNNKLKIHEETMKTVVENMRRYPSNSHFKNMGSQKYFALQQQPQEQKFLQKILCDVSFGSQFESTTVPSKDDQMLLFCHVFKSFL